MSFHKILAPVPTFYIMMTLVLAVLALRLSAYFFFVGYAVWFVNFLFWQRRDAAR